MATADKPVQRKVGTLAATDHKDEHDAVFSEWRKRRSSRDRQNSDVIMQNLVSKNMNQVLGMRRMTLLKGKSDASVEMLSKPRQKLENTYKMKPDEGTLFSEKKVNEMVSSILEYEVGENTYNQAMASKMACDLASKIKIRLKDLNCPRYKIVCNVITGPMCGQGMEAASRCVWDHKTDNFTYVTYSNKSMFAVAIVHALYYE